jgi:peptide/nickel transport system substrate-binding protein
MSGSRQKACFLAFMTLLGSLFILPETAPAKERTVVMGDFSALQSLDPAASSLGTVQALCKNIFQGLLRYKFNSSMELEGDLAESWSVSKGGLVYTFRLRDNVQWHKGFGKVTTQDVKFSFDRVMDPQTRSVYMGDLTSSVKSIRAIDARTVEITLKERDAVFLHKCTRPKPVAIVSQKAVEKYGRDFGRNPIGSGPFVFESMSREQVVLTANKDYYEGPPQIDRVVCKVIPDMDTLMMAILTGDIDLIWVLPREKAALDRIKDAGCKVKVLDRGAWIHFLINPQVAPLGDLRVRQAMAHAIDRDEIITHILSGMAEKLNSPVPKGYFGHTEEGLRKYEYDPQKAKELLSQAGYPGGFETTLDTYNSPSVLPAAIAVQGQLAKVGIKANLSTTDNPAYMKKITGGTATTALYLASRSPDADFPLTNFFHTAGFSPGTNLMRYNKLDKEIDEARGEMDGNKRLKMYQAIQKRLMEDLPAIPLFVMHYPTPYRSHIAGLPDRDPVWGIDFYPVHLLQKK